MRAECSNPDCQFFHPDRSRIKCRYHPCTRSNCPFAHPSRSHRQKFCKFGDRCYNPNCKFLHPDDEDSEDDFDEYEYEDDDDFFEEEEKSEDTDEDEDYEDGNYDQVDNLDQEMRAYARVLSLKNEFQCIDLVFMIDCTGSMKPYIEMAKNEMQNIINSTKNLACNKNLDFRVGIVAYRDHLQNSTQLKAPRLEILPLSSPTEAIKFLDRLEAVGGDDGPEDVNGGLQEALKLSWREANKSATRYLVHICDAPCHGREYHDDMGDSFPNGHQKDIPFKSLFEKLNKMKINYLFLKITDYTDIMINKFRGYFTQSHLAGSPTGFYTEKISKNDGKLFTDIISTSIQRSYFESLSQSVMIYGKNPECEERDTGDEFKKLRDLSKKLGYTKLNLKNDVKAMEANWNSGLTEKTDCISYFLYSTKLDPDEVPVQVIKKVHLEVNPIPFAKGHFSYAHYCKYHTPREDGKTDVFEAVLKRPIRTKNDSYYKQGLEKNLDAIICQFCIILLWMRRELEGN
jgi:von Willebrand factor type A domain.